MLVSEQLVHGPHTDDTAPPPSLTNHQLTRGINNGTLLLSPLSKGAIQCKQIRQRLRPNPTAKRTAHDQGHFEFLVFVNLRIASLLHHMYVAWAHQCHLPRSSLITAMSSSQQYNGVLGSRWLDLDLAKLLLLSRGSLESPNGRRPMYVGMCLKRHTKLCTHCMCVRVSF